MGRDSKGVGGSFLGGAFFLALAGILARLLGLYRLVLPRFIGATGVGLYHMAYPVYAMTLALSTGGLSVAISKLVSDRVAQGQYRNAYRVFQLSFWLLASMGLLLSWALYEFAPMITAQVAKDPRAYPSIVAISPALFFVAILSAYRGFFQGLQEMGPTGFSQIVEQLFRVGTMAVLVILLRPYGIPYAAAGATIGAVVGALGADLYLYRHLGAKRRELRQKSKLQNREPREPLRSIIREMIYFAAPISLAGLAMPFIQMIDLWLVPSLLQHRGLSVTETTRQYGELSGYAMPLIGVPTILTGAIAIALVPAVSEYMAMGSLSQAAKQVRDGLRVTWLIGLPASLGLMVLATPITQLLFKSTFAGPLLWVLAPSSLAISISLVAGAALQGLGQPLVPVRNLILGTVLKYAATWYLVSRIGILGAAWATTLGLGFTSMFNLFEVHKKLQLRFIFKPLVPLLLSAGGMGIAVASLWRLGQHWQVGASVDTLLCLAFGVLVYVFLLAYTGGVTPTEIRAVPRIGDSLFSILERVGVTR